MTMRARPWLRPALGFLTLTQAVVGIWQLLVPRSFYDLYWVELLPPYNEHLLRDVGGLNLALAVVLGASALIMDRRLISTALLAYLTFPPMPRCCHHLCFVIPSRHIATEFPLVIELVGDTPGFWRYARCHACRPARPPLRYAASVYPCSRRCAPASRPGRPSR
jgi:hypothetical protein